SVSSEGRPARGRSSGLAMASRTPLAGRGPPRSSICSSEAIELGHPPLLARDPESLQPDRHEMWQLREGRFPAAGRLSGLRPQVDRQDAAVPAGREGSVVTYTVIHDAPAQFEMQKPYVMAIIEMDEGVRLTSQLIDVKPEDVRIGMKVQASFRKLGQDGDAGVIHYGYKFRPAG